MTAPPPNIGETVGRWRLESILGEGGMARVYLGIDEAGARVALKVMTGELANAELVGRFEQEARLLMRLRHPHLVQVFDAGRSGPSPWMAMECLMGRPIGALIRAHGRLELSVAMPLLAQLADALSALHAAGVVHRDVKPANVMVSAEGWVTLLDLGIARSSESALTRTGVVFGTPGYMAPEQIMGERNIGPAADVYAFAVMTWRMLTGQAPFQAKGDALLLEHLQAKRPVLADVNPDLPSGLTPVLQTALAVQPGERYPHLGALWEAMEIALEGTGHLRTVHHALERVNEEPLAPVTNTAPRSSNSGLRQVEPAAPRSSNSGLRQVEPAAPRSSNSGLRPLVPVTETNPAHSPVTSPPPGKLNSTVSQRRPQFLDDSTTPLAQALPLPEEERASPIGQEHVGTEVAVATVSLDDDNTDATRASLRAVDDAVVRDWARAARVLGIIAACAVGLVIVALLLGQPNAPPPPMPMAGPTYVSPPLSTQAEAPEADPDLIARREKAEKLASTSVPTSRSGYSREKVREYAPRSVRKLSIISRGGQPMVEIIALVGGLKVKAEVDIDGKRAGTTPVIVPIDRRKHSVRVEASPHPPSRFDLSSYGESMRLEVELVPLGAEGRAKVATPF